MTTVNNPTIIQGLLSIEDKHDHIFMHLIESAKFNKGNKKVYIGVPGNLVAFACKVSVDKDMKVFLLLMLKQLLLNIMNNHLVLHIFVDVECLLKPSAALRLISHYFKS